MPEEGPPRGPVLLTGATGFVGQRLQAKLLDDGYKVRVLVRHGSPRAEAIDSRAERVAGDLANPQALARGLAGTRGVINCAGAVRGAQPADFAPANVDGVRALATAIRRLSQPPGLLHLSSLAAKRPEVSYYAASKRAGEDALAEFDDLTWTVFRPPAIYGPGDVEVRPILNLARRGVVFVPGGNRAQRLSLLHVDDLCRAVLTWLKAPARYRQHTYELDDGHDRGYSWQDILDAVCTEPMFNRQVMVPVPGWLLSAAGAVNEQLAKVRRRPPMLTRGKVHELIEESWLCDTSLFSRASSWRPEIGLEEGAAVLYESGPA